MYKTHTDLSTLGVWSQHVDDLDTGLKDLLLNAHLNECWSLGVDRSKATHINLLHKASSIENEEYSAHQKANKIKYAHGQRLCNVMVVPLAKGLATDYPICCKAACSE